MRRVSREGRHASINPKLLRKFQSRCWLELRCNLVVIATSGSVFELFQSRCWLELRCNDAVDRVERWAVEFQSRCWLELRCNPARSTLRRRGKGAKQWSIFSKMPRLSKKQHFLRNFAKHGLGKKELSSRSTPFYTKYITIISPSMVNARAILTAVPTTMPIQVATPTRPA